MSCCNKAAGPSFPFVERGRGFRTRGRPCRRNEQNPRGYTDQHFAAFEIVPGTRGGVPAAVIDVGPSDIPIVFTAQAPAVDGPGNKVALFGHGEGYLVAVRNAFEMDASRHAAWNSSYVVYRAIGRVFCQMREATAFATLKIGPR